MKIVSLRNLKSSKENFAFGTETPISEIALALRERKIGAVPIVDQDNKLLGIVSERDIVSKLVVEAKDADLTTAKEIMTSKIITAKLNDDINYTIDVMKNNNIRHMPVLDANNRLTDFFSIRDFLRAEMQDNVEIKEKHKNVVRYQIMVSVLLIGTTAAGVFFDFFERKNLVVIFSTLFLIIGISAVMTIRSNKRYNRED
ncbi:MAG: CBS domain-containing protein [Proteobacteria bacterium]|nr:CBS domain-containing protein [Pseudomonadota bacterium]NBT38675.1 CBS domain-containing protein [Candidatus Fonsibacter sp. PEL3]NBU54425.1 CBS domain-containing protein [Candidatus Fonsibacter sp. PEL3]NCU47289.1 CBS domain-containing protein [Candidatus Fonsibacter lacus]NDC44217.1 CBS domain-containing protein [Pseudomonadota bacterium]